MKYCKEKGTKRHSYADNVHNQYNCQRRFSTMETTNQQRECKWIDSEAWGNASKQPDHTTKIIQSHISLKSELAIVSLPGRKKKQKIS